MLTAIEVVAPDGVSFDGLVMPVTDATPDELIFVRHVDGIDPVDAEVTSKGYGQVDGDFYIGSRVGKRNIVLTLGLNDVETALPILYAYFMPKSGVTLKFTVDGYPGDPVYISGYVETAPFPHFSQDPEMQISIICPKPNFWKFEEMVTGVSGDAPTEVEIEYQGNQITGFDVKLEIPVGGFNGDLFIELNNLEGGVGYRHFLLDNVTIPGEKTVHFNSVQGSKRVESLPIDEDYPNNSLLGTMSNDSFWLTLWPGTNVFRIRTPDWDTGYDWELRYSEQFGGI